MPSSQLREVSGGITLKNVVASDLGNADTSYSYLEFGNVNWRFISLIYTITATTMTVEASNDPMTVADASKTWFDVSTEVLGAANVTATGGKRVEMEAPYGKLRFKRVTTNATNAFKLDICLAN